MRIPSWLPLTLAAWLVAAAIAVAATFSGIRALDLPDTDDAMRLVQVRDWFDGQAWGDIDQKRMNPPAGASMHWSRLADLPIIAIRGAAAPLVGTALAERAAVAIVPLLAMFFAMSMAATAGSRLGGSKAGIFAMLFLLGTGPLMSLFAPLRIDHHNWQIALLIALLAMLSDPARRARSGIAAGLAVVASLAIGLEMLPHIALAGAVLVIGWALDPSLGRMLRGFGVAIALGTLAAYPLFVPHARWMVAMCDALSPAYLVALVIAGSALVLLPSLALLSTPARRAGGAVAAAAFAWATAASLYPQCAAGPLAALDPRLTPMLAVITEARGLFDHVADKPATIPYFGFYPLVGIAAGVMLWRRAEGRGRFAAALWLVTITASSVLMILQIRAAIGPNALAAVLCGVAAATLLPRVRTIEAMPRRLLSTLVLLICLTSVLPTGVALAVARLSPERPAKGDDAPGGLKACTAAATLAPLGAMAPATIANVRDMGPALLLHTRHRVMSGPYHRNVDAMLDSWRLWQAGDAEARRIARRYGATLLLTCANMPEPTMAAKAAPGGLAARLAAGRAPSWLEPVTLPAETPLKLYRIRG